MEQIKVLVRSRRRGGMGNECVARPGACRGSACVYVCACGVLALECSPLWTRPAFVLLCLIFSLSMGLFPPAHAGILGTGSTSRRVVFPLL